MKLTVIGCSAATPVALNARSIELNIIDGVVPQALSSPRMDSPPQSDHNPNPLECN